VKILPILNFNFGEIEVLSQDEIDYIYSLAVELCIQEFGEFELSLSSDRAYESFAVIMDALNSKHGKICFGSVNSTEQFYFLQKILREKNPDLLSSDKLPIKIFSPAYYDDLAIAIDKTKEFKYIPGLFLEDELALVASYDELKIFPYAIDKKYSLRKALQAPYPELSKAIYQSKILEFTDRDFNNYGIKDKTDMEDGLTKIRSVKQGEEVVLINKPFDYQSIRAGFLINPKLKIAFINDKVYDSAKLIKSIMDKKLYLTGLGAVGDCVVHSANYVFGTRVFNNIILDLLSGAVKIYQLKDLMLEEFKRRYSCLL
jgi:hypothetical protein